MGKRKAVLSDDSEEDSGRNESDASKSPEQGEETFMVEVIMKARVNDDGEVEYRVRWARYSPEDDSWEPQENVKECTRLLRSFWSEVGIERRKNPGPPGTVYTASEAWIKKEIAFFWKEYELAEREKEEEDAKKKKKESKKTAKYASKDDAPSKSKLVKHSSYNSLFSDDDDSDDVPLSSLVPDKKGKGKEVLKNTKGVSKASTSSNKAGTSLKLSIPAPAKNKYSSMKINKKSAEASPIQPKPLGKSVVQAEGLPKPKPSMITTFSKRSSVTNTTATGASTSNSHSANLLRNSLPPRPRLSMPSVSSTEPPRATGDEVDNVLVTIMPFENAKALPALKMGPTPSTSGIRFEKKWKWSGDLFFGTPEIAKKLCNIIINDASDISSVGQRMRSMMEPEKDSLRFSKAYRRSEINVILRSLKKVDQIARISYLAEGDKNPFSIFVKYLARKNLVVSTAGMSIYGHVAEMIIFPPTNKDLCKRLNVPPRYLVNDSLVLALMPYHIPPSKYRELYFRSDEIRYTAQDEELPKTLEALPMLALRPGLEKFLRALDFPQWFLSFLPLRRYCVWAFRVEPTLKDQGKGLSGALRDDTRALLAVLSYLKAENVGHTGDVRVVFVHVGAVQTINRIRALADWRCNKPEVRFVTYGYHENVKPSLWGFSEIYPLGGIVTFTSSALLENPLGIGELIERIHRHPFWECYIHPSVLSVFVRLSCPEEDPVSVYSNEPLRFGRILELIEEGKVALMQSPGLAEQAPPRGDIDATTQWISAQMAMLTKRPTDHLEDCWSTFISEYSHTTEKELPGLIESEIVKDLSLLQIQPVMRKNHRRFVVIKAVQDTRIAWNKDGFEWRTVQDFDFNDGYPKDRFSVQ
ncbi:hypothetical protein M0805_008335 [Coniferiporia weirii]|nr:hypothetical protein M0805_008335 [Coniferiporia weirii]